MEISKLKAILEDVSHEINEQINFDVFILVINLPQSKDLHVIIISNDLPIQTRTLPDAMFLSFKILAGNLFIVTGQPGPDNTSFIDRILDDRYKQLRSNIVIPIQNKKLGNGALLLGSYHQNLHFQKRMLETTTIDALILHKYNELPQGKEQAKTKKEQHDLYKTIFQHSAFAMVILNAERIIIDANDEFEKLTGFKKSKLIEKVKIDDLIRSENNKTLYSSLHDVTSPTTQNELTIICKYDEEKNVYMKVIPLGTSRQYLLQFTDITMLNAQKIELKEEQDKISTIQKFINLLYSCSNLQNLFNTIYRNFEEIIAYDCIAFVLYFPDYGEINLFLNTRKNSKHLVINDENIITNFLVHFHTNQKIEFHQVFNIIEYPINNHFKSYHCIKLSNDDDVIGAVCIANDIENAYSEFHNDMMKKICEQTLKFIYHALEYEKIKMTSNYKKKYEDIQNLIHTFSHNLRTPMVSLDGFATLLLEEFQDKLNDEGKHYLSRIKTNTKYMENTINELLNISTFG